MTETDRLTVSEVSARILGLTDDDYIRILYMARTLMPVTPSMSLDDYLNEALKRLLAGERTVPRNQDFSTCLISIMRSLASEASKRQVLTSGVMPDDEVMSDGMPDHVQNLIHAETLDQLQHLVIQDQCAVDILRLRAVGNEKKEICKEMNIKPTTYESAMKRIHRAVLKYQQEAVT